jgi:hypothetical protein
MSTHMFMVAPVLLVGRQIEGATLGLQRKLPLSGRESLRFLGFVKPWELRFLSSVYSDSINCTSMVHSHARKTGNLSSRQETIRFYGKRKLTVIVTKSHY